ncbi:MAG TPA: nucleoside phosphorylase [Propionibacteriaceae bacterium]|nr:nucleoside phosphorylase [Propionibacteriaceae bacterium]
MDLPILEYDSDPDDLIRPGLRERLSKDRLPRIAVVTFLGEISRGWVAARRWRIASSVDMVISTVPVWTGMYEGVEIAVTELPVGAPAAVIVVEQLLALGVDTIVAVGSCGALVQVEAGEFLLPVRALRDEGTSYHYLPPERWVETDPQVREACRSALAARQFAATDCDTWTTDAFFRETAALVAARREEGCSVVEMECAALAACCTLRGARFGQILYSADTLAGEEHDVRGWAHPTRSAALRAALDAAALLAR